MKENIKKKHLKTNEFECGNKKGKINEEKALLLDVMR